MNRELYGRDPTNYKEDIFHYGRKGMKWYQNIFSKFSNKSSKRRSKSARSVVEKNKDVKISDIKKKVEKNLDLKTAYKYRRYYTQQELTNLVKRYNTETQLKKLASEQSKRKITRGEQFIRSGLKYAKLADEVYKFTNSDLGKALKKHRNKSKRK